MAHIIETNTLPGNETSRQFEGHLYGGAPISFFASATPVGRGPRLHQHPYEEIFVVEDGTLTFTVGTETIEATSGQTIVVPPETPHKFVNTGTTIAHHLDIHAAAQMRTTWLE